VIIGGYHINGYWWILVVINDYYIIGYGGYSIGGY
jgi:hypothetical protein